MNAANDTLPVFAPDGSRIAFQSNRKGPYDLYLARTDQPGNEELLLETPHDKYPRDWSRDGRFLLYGETAGRAGNHLWALDLQTRGKPLLIAAETFGAVQGQISPDGKWVALETRESGRVEIVVQAFPGGGRRRQVSIDGGSEPRWHPAGGRLYYIAADARMMAATVHASDRDLEVGYPQALFQTRIVGRGQKLYLKQQYAVSRDGRFLVNQTVDELRQSPITLILNWRPKA
jgi:Tol biopolymer transport system component